MSGPEPAPTIPEPPSPAPEAPPDEPVTPIIPDPGTAPFPSPDAPG